MPIQIQGAGGSVVEAGAFAAEGLHTINKPHDYGTLGHYRFSVVTGTMAAALGASAAVLQFRWTDATRFAIIYLLRSQFQTLTAFTAATLTDHTSLNAFVARAYTAQTSSGTLLTMTGDNQAMRTSMGTSLVGSINVATTAALTAGTHTLDTQPFAQSLSKGNIINAAAGTEYGNWNIVGLDFVARVADGVHPIVLAQNEGIVVQNRTVWPAAGTGVYKFEMAWAEVPAF